jgi:hypothetical protein
VQPIKIGAGAGAVSGAVLAVNVATPNYGGVSDMSGEYGNGGYGNFAYPDTPIATPGEKGIDGLIIIHEFH